MHSNAPLFVTLTFLLLTTFIISTINIKHITADAHSQSHCTPFEYDDDYVKEKSRTHFDDFESENEEEEDDDEEGDCKGWLVQSIPTDMPHLTLVPGVLSTADVFRWLAANSSKSLDIIAQYWQLVAHPNDPRSGDYGYTEQDMNRYGANKGFQVYKAIENAADRDVNIRLLQHSGVYPDYTQEPSDLASGRPNVKNVTLLLDEWWGSGIVHTKVWLSDKKDVYIGSANNDWKSLTQVKELGVYLVNCPKIARKVEKYFSNLWMLANLNSSACTKSVFDQQWQINRKVPCWSHFLHPNERCRFVEPSFYLLHNFKLLKFEFFFGYNRSPLSDYVKTPHVLGYPVISDPYMFKIPIQTQWSNITSLEQSLSYLSFAPPELSFGKFLTDEQAWVDTIKSVEKGSTIRISTMDWLGQSQYADETVYWSTLSSALSEVVFTKHAKVKVLVAYWAHFINNTDLYLKSLLYTNKLCNSSKYNKCSGNIEIKYYLVPGYNLTGPAKINNGSSTVNLYPGFSRVNHGKYGVSDVRAHISTSNLIWDYFYTTAGVSFGTYNKDIVKQLQQIFDADWNSPYAVNVHSLEEGYVFSS